VEDVANDGLPDAERFGPTLKAWPESSTYLRAFLITRPNAAPPGSMLSVERPSEESGCQSVRVMPKGLLGYSEHDCQPSVDGVDDAHGHLRNGVPVVGTHGAALVLPAATCGHPCGLSFISAIDAHHPVVQTLG
jgi:hypothetical protein